MANRDALQEELLKNDPEYRQLHEQHQALKQKLAALYDKSLLSQEDDLEVKRIKHEKLWLKDQMALILREREAQVSA